MNKKERVLAVMRKEKPDMIPAGFITNQIILYRKWQMHI